MEIVKIICSRLDQYGMPVAEAARRSRMSADALAKSLKGTRQLKSDEFVSLCAVLGLGLGDFKDQQKTA